jgi:allantoicase
MSEALGLGIHGLVDLAAAALGGRAVGASDEFFAPAEQMLAAGRAVFEPARYSERGKWMDGWETRRKRVPGHDYALIELGASGVVRAFDIDTQHFVGNHPPFAQVDGVSAPRGTPASELLQRAWRPLLQQSPLNPGSQNLFVAEPSEPVSHVRLSIFPDGGVARFRVFGNVIPSFDAPEIDEASRAHVTPDLVDLVALKNGGVAVACSDARFSPMNHLLLPDRALDMGGGWETRRARSPGHVRDWVILKLGARGNLRVVELDTAFFKGNYPDRASLEGLDAPHASITELIRSEAWQPLLPEMKLAADTRHFFGSELVPHAPVSHVRVNIVPDGGISRVRLWGKRDG